jgi:hypothetical protein
MILLLFHQDRVGSQSEILGMGKEKDNSSSLIHNLKDQLLVKNHLSIIRKISRETNFITKVETF